MPLFEDVGIGLEPANSSQKIIYECSKQHWLCWMWLWEMLFCVCRRCYLINIVVEGLKWSNMKRPYVDHLFNVDGQINHSLDVVLANIQCMLCGQFSRATTMLVCDWLAYGMFNATFWWNMSWQMVLSLVHDINMGNYIVM
jgi:hypothetical protein